MALNRRPAGWPRCVAERGGLPCVRVNRGRSSGRGAMRRNWVAVAVAGALIVLAASAWGKRPLAEQTQDPQAPRPASPAPGRAALVIALGLNDEQPSDWDRSL